MATKESTPSPEKKPSPDSVPKPSSRRDTPFDWYEDIEEIHLSGLEDSSSDEEDAGKKDEETSHLSSFKRDKTLEQSTEQPLVTERGRCSKSPSSAESTSSLLPEHRHDRKPWHLVSLPKFLKKPSGKLKSPTGASQKSPSPSLRSPRSSRSPRSPRAVAQRLANVTVGKLFPKSEGTVRSKEARFGSEEVQYRPSINLATVTKQDDVPQEVSTRDSNYIQYNSWLTIHWLTMMSFCRWPVYHVENLGMYQLCMTESTM